jgi:hypothetical protein
MSSSCSFIWVRCHLRQMAAYLLLCLEECRALHEHVTSRACWPHGAGTMRLQLENKGDYGNAYTNFGNVVVAFAFITIPIIGWLLDKKVGACTLLP